MTENPSFYAIIPANVRYSSITPNAKLLFGEITALTNKTGKCYATNEYFSKLYNVSKVSISKWIKELIDSGFIKSEIIYKEGTKQILNRYITILNDPIKEIFNTPIKEKLKDNNTSINNTINNTYKKKRPTLEEIKEYSKQRNRLDLAEKFYDYYQATDWKDKENKPVKNWKAKFITWENHNEQKKSSFGTWGDF